MTTQVKEKLEQNEILKLFKSGCKSQSEHKIGIEYERLPLSNKDFKMVDYSIIHEFLRTFARNENWDYITDDYNIIGLKQVHDTITLEPGCQVELSLEPQLSIKDIENKVNELNKQFSPILQKYNFGLYDYGVSPISTYKNIKILPKKRYHLMAGYLWGILSDVMMRETAGIQCCLDFKDEQDAMRKFRLANLLSPFMTAMFANSPIRGGVETGYKSFRALSWLNTDSERCGICGKIKNDFGFENYVDKILETPMIFIKRNEKNIPLNGKLTFRQFMKNGYEGFDANIEDFKLQANLCFPEVRLRNFIEIRNHDCVNHNMQYSILALYKGLLYDDCAMDELDEMFKNIKYHDLSELRYIVPKNALQSKLKKHIAGDYAKEIIKIAQKSLIKNGLNEEKYLEPLNEFTLKGLCPADLIIANWNGSWNKNIKKLIDFIKK